MREMMPRPDDEADPFFDPRDEQVRQMGLQLATIVGTPGYQALLQQLRRRTDEVGRLAVRDEKRGRKYWQGYLDCAEALEREVKQLVDDARQVQEERELGAADLMGRGGSLVEDH